MEVEGEEAREEVAVGEEEEEEKKEEDGGGELVLVTGAIGGITNPRLAVKSSRKDAISCSCTQNLHIVDCLKNFFTKRSLQLSHFFIVDGILKS